MYALDAGVIDGAIVGGFDDDIPYRPEGKIVTRSEYLPRYAQSKYGGNPPLCAELSRAVNDLGIKRIGIIGCPCHVHALRKIQANGQPSGIADSLTLVLGLFCAAQFYFEGTRHILRELCGVESLDGVAQIGYQEGDWPGRFCVRTKSGKEILLDRHEYVYHQLLPLWQRDRCMMCLDHTAELADVSFGDYWIPGSKPGDAGWSLAIARNARGMKLLADAAGAGYIVKEQVSIGEASGAEFKKHRSPFVLQRRRRYGLPVPQYDYTADYEPGGRKTIHRAPAFDQLVVEQQGSRTSAADSGK
jgi:coenzyme F420 hydrogenase subunit beta